MVSVCGDCGNEYANLSKHFYRNPSHKPESWNECPECGERYNHLGKHWSRSDCNYPELTQRQYEVAVGLVMGDGTINKGGKNPYLQCSMITKEYLEYLDNIFGVLSTGVRLRQTAEESAQFSRNSGFRPNAKKENYHDMYTLQTCHLPQLDEFSSWYDSGEKVWPMNIELTPTVLKHWYVGDGCYQNNGTKDCIKIGLSNEKMNEEKVSSYFKKVGLPSPNRWSITVQNENGRSYENCQAKWNVEESYKLLEYMLKDGYGIPNGFEYKWPESFC